MNAVVHPIAPAAAQAAPAAPHGASPSDYSRCSFWPPERGMLDALTRALKEAFTNAPVTPPRDALLSPGLAGGIGNAREPSVKDVWFDLPVLPDVEPPPPLPGAHGPASHERFQLHGLLAPRRYDKRGLKAPLFVVVPGFFDSVEQHYVRDTLAACAEMGGSVLTLDMRDHGDTRRHGMRGGAQPVRYSFGRFEGADVVGVLEQLADAVPEHVRDVYLIGYSGGARTVLRAMETLAAASDATRRKVDFVSSRAASSMLRVRGALAVCPPIDVAATLGGIATAFGHFFDQLARLRGLDGVNHAVWDTRAYYAERGVDVHPALATHPFGFEALPDERLVEAVALSTIVMAEDDPVVGRAQFDAYAAALGPRLGAARAPLGLFQRHLLRCQKGGHCAFVVVNQALTRRWLWSWVQHAMAVADRAAPAGA
ncbi:MAG: hypothetical protein U1F43_37940 [Myxococcota bacterium]